MMHVVQDVLRRGLVKQAIVPWEPPSGSPMSSEVPAAPAPRRPTGAFGFGAHVGGAPSMPAGAGQPHPPSAPAGGVGAAPRPPASGLSLTIHPPAAQPQTNYLQQGADALQHFTSGMDPRTLGNFMPMLSGPLHAVGGVGGIPALMGATDWMTGNNNFAAALGLGQATPHAAGSAYDNYMNTGGRAGTPEYISMTPGTSSRVPTYSEAAEYLRRQAQRPTSAPAPASAAGTAPAVATPVAPAPAPAATTPATSPDVSGSAGAPQGVYLDAGRQRPWMQPGNAAAGDIGRPTSRIGQTGTDAPQPPLPNPPPGASGGYHEPGPPPPLETVPQPASWGSRTPGSETGPSRPEGQASPALPQPHLEQFRQALRLHPTEETGVMEAVRRQIYQRAVASTPAGITPPRYDQISDSSVYRQLYDQTRQNMRNHLGREPSQAEITQFAGNAQNPLMYAILQPYRQSNFLSDIMPGSGASHNPLPGSGPLGEAGIGAAMGAPGGPGGVALGLLGVPAFHTLQSQLSPAGRQASQEDYSRRMADSQNMMGYLYETSQNPNLSWMQRNVAAPAGMFGQAVEAAGQTAMNPLPAFRHWFGGGASPAGQ